MLRDIIRKEIMDNISTLKFVVTFAVVTVLVIAGLIIGSRNYLEQRDNTREQVRLNKELMDSQYNWDMAGGVGLLQAKSPYILSVIDSGIDNSLGRLATVNTAQQPHLDKSRNLTAPILAVFGDVDLTFVVRIILSLFVILLTYDALSGEKERGTLKLSLANEVPRHNIILGKIIGGFCVIIVSFVVPLLIGLAFMMGFYPQVLQDLNPDAWIRLLLIVGVYLLYLTVFFAVGLLVSALCHRSSVSFVVLLMIWVLFVTIIPRLSLTAAERLRPTESYAKLQSEGYSKVSENRKQLYQEKYIGRIRELQTQQQREIMQAFASPNPKEAFRTVLDKYVKIGVELQSDLSRDELELRRKASQEMEEIYEREQDYQLSLAGALARSLSPTSAMNFAVQNLAGTGWARQRHYAQRLREFQKEYMDYIREERQKVQPTTLSEVFQTQKVDVGIDRIKFDYREEDLSDIVNRILWDIGILAILSLIFCTAAFVAFLRYDVR
jgi:ABC-type transport system involved in multi-copper enzyme maturation permease subunit